MEFPITEVPPVAHPTLAQVVRTIRLSPRTKAESADTDADLLSRLVRTRDEDAFRALVHRHGKTVLAACRQVLTDPADADDAFQATFLVLLKKAKRLAANPAPLGGWLYAVAHRVAVRGRADRHRRTAREAEAARRAERTTEQPDLSWREATDALHEELNALPDKYRLPLLLCGVQGLTRDEAADELGTTVGAVRGQLERGRALLERRIAKRGIVLSAGWLAVVMASSRAAGGPSHALIDLAARLAGGHLSPTVAALATGAFPMIPALKPVAVAVAAVVLAFGLTVGLVSPQPAAHADEKPAMKADKKADPKDEVKPAAKERTITGTVLDADGKPIAADLALVWFEGKSQPLGKANADGTFKVTVPMTRGKYGGWLVAKAPGHGVDFLAHAVSYQAATMTPTAEVTLKLPKERPLKGRLIDQQGKPVAGARVVASHIAAFDSDASRDGHFKTWAMEIYQRGGFPMGDRNMEFADGHHTKADEFLPSPYSATSDADGRFEIAGLGSNHLVNLLVHGTGVSDKYLVALNRDGFDAAPVNKMAKDHERKEYSFGGKWVLYGPDPTVVLEPEKIVRGRITDHDGKPRAGVTVAFTRPNKRDLTHEWNQAVTDKDGKYEIRGARKHKGYMVEIPPDPPAGLLECQGFADDTVGYEPITIDLKSAKGVVVTGRVTNKATGEPVAAQLYVDVMANNPFVENYPPFLHRASSASKLFQTDTAGRYRVVVIPGRIMLMAAPQGVRRGEFKPPVPDPKYPDAFTREHGGHLMFHHHGGGQGFVQGSWCKVLDAKPGDTELTVDIELEPATKTFVKVVDADGKPVTGMKATGVTHVEFDHPTEYPTTDALTVYNLESKAERLVAVRHEKRNLVGTLNLTAETKDPVVTLGAAGTVTGRAVDKDGKPLAGLSLEIRYDNRPVQEASGGIRDGSAIGIDANGEFKVEGLFPGQAFRVFFHKGRTRFGPDYDKTPKRTVAKHGDTLKLGNLKLEPSKTDGEE